MSRTGTREIPLGDDEKYRPSKKDNYMQVVAGFLHTGTCAVSCLELDQAGSNPQVRGGIVANSDDNEIVVNITVLNHDRGIINTTKLVKTDRVPLWQGRKTVDQCPVKADPKGLLKPQVGNKNGQMLVTLVQICVETSPDDILEVSIRNVEMYRHNKSVIDIMVVRKKEANPRIKTHTYGFLEPHDT